MVSPIYSNINSLFAASFSDLSKTTALNESQRNQGIDALKRLQQAERPPINAIGDEQQGKSRNAQNRFALPDERQPSLASFTKPKVTLNPTEELALFAAPPASEEDTPPDAVFDVLFENAHNEDKQQETLNIQLMNRKQSYVANLYSRTGDIAFSNDHVLNAAA